MISLAGALMFMKFAQNLNPRFILLSCLSCPTCWELLSVLGAGTADFKVRGHHTSVLPTELPGWLPADVVNVLLLQFRDYLCQELTVLMEQSNRDSPLISQIDLSPHHDTTT